MTPDEIRALRTDLSCTAKELAGALDVEQSTVFAWERGELFPTKKYVDRMGALRAKGADAIPRKASRREREDPVRALADPQLWQLVRKLAAHSKLRAAVAKLAEGYSDPIDE